jgi:hypothetical protein
MMSRQATEFRHDTPTPASSSSNLEHPDISQNAFFVTSGDNRPQYLLVDMLVIFQLSDVFLSVSGANCLGPRPVPLLLL